MIKAYRDTLAFREKYPDELGWAGKYSYFDEVYKRSDLRDWAECDGNRKRLMDWIYKERVRTGIDIRKLPLILKDKYATKILSKSNVEKAFTYLAKKDPTLGDDLYRNISEVVRAIHRMSGKQLMVAARDPNRGRLIRDLAEVPLGYPKGFKDFKDPALTREP